MDQPAQTTDTDAVEGGTIRQTDEQRTASRDLSLSAIETPVAIPGYEIINKLGTGSFGAVWLARETKTGKQVAIKFYNHRRGLDWSLLTREVEKLAVLYTSRDIVGLLDVGWDHDPPYFVMEFLEHGSLQSRLQQGPLPVENAVQIATSVARALVHAHSSGILHCDLKPANVLLDGNDEPRLGDFGQSRLTTEQSPALGTMYYMAPEQADLNAVPGARWDVYALGALLYEMLTGEPPYRTEETERQLRSVGKLEDRLHLYQKLINESPRPNAHREVKGVDKRLAAIIDGCLKPDPQLRLPSVHAVLDKLQRRTTARSRRPLIAVGFLGPILFMLAMFWIARVTFRNARTAAETSLINQALAGDSVSALILADSIKRDVDSRLDQVQDVADSEVARRIAGVLDLEAKPETTIDENGQDIPLNIQLLNLLEGRSPGHELQPDYTQLVGTITANEQQLERDGRTNNASWFIVGTHGKQVFRVPARKNGGEIHDTIGESFYWRGYYTGLDYDLLPEKNPFEAVTVRTEPGVSSHFRSQATHQYMVCMAAPIWDEDHQLWEKQGRQGPDPGRALGVVGCTIHIFEILKQWEHMIRDQDSGARINDRFLALAAYDEQQRQAMLLDHPWMTQENLRGVATAETREQRNNQLDEFMTEMRIRDTDAGDLAALVKADNRRHYTEPEYDDPFGKQADEFRGKWLASFAQVKPTHLIAIVQERREAAIEPVQKVNRIFAYAAVVAIIVFGVLLAILWYFLNRASSSR